MKPKHHMVLTGQFSSRVSHQQAHNKGIERLLNETPLMPLKELCDYAGKCSKPCIKNTERHNYCQLRRFMDRWGINYFPTS